MANFLGKSWCKLLWSPWVRFSDSDLSAMPDEPGVYRVKPIGKSELMYIGQTGSSLRERLRTLRRETLQKKMPFNDPHTAAPNLWAWKDSDGISYECSAAPIKLSKRDRLARECYLLSQYRVEKGESPRCNFGRFHPKYKKSRSRSSHVRGRRLSLGKLNEAGKPSAPPLRSNGQPSDSNWMRLRWIEDKRGKGQALPVSGVYKILNSKKQLIYVGKSRNHLASRARSHIRIKRLGQAVSIWVAALSGRQPNHHFLELENDLIGNFYEKNKAAPKCQFSG